jgi:hypothetical protein
VFFKKNKIMKSAICNKKRRREAPPEYIAREMQTSNDDIEDGMCEYNFTEFVHGCYRRLHELSIGRLEGVCPHDPYVKNWVTRSMWWHVEVDAYLKQNNYHTRGIFMLSIVNIPEDVYNSMQSGMVEVILSRQDLIDKFMSPFTRLPNPTVARGDYIPLITNITTLNDNVVAIIGSYLHAYYVCDCPDVPWIPSIPLKMQRESQWRPDVSVSSSSSDSPTSSSSSAS